MGLAASGAPCLPSCAVRGWRAAAAGASAGAPLKLGSYPATGGATPRRALVGGALPRRHSAGLQPDSEPESATREWAPARRGGVGGLPINMQAIHLDINSAAGAKCGDARPATKRRADSAVNHRRGTLRGQPGAPEWPQAILPDPCIGPARSPPRHQEHAADDYQFDIKGRQKRGNIEPTHAAPVLVRTSVRPFCVLLARPSAVRVRLLASAYTVRAPSCLLAERCPCAPARALSLCACSPGAASSVPARSV